MSEQANLHSPLRIGRLAVAQGVFILCHGVVATLMLLVMRGLQWAVEAAHPDPLFDVVPVRYIFDGMDAILLALFVLISSLEAFHIFRGR